MSFHQALTKHISLNVITVCLCVTACSTAGEGPSCISQVLSERANSPWQRETSKRKLWDESREKAEDHRGQREGHRGERKGEERCYVTHCNTSLQLRHTSWWIRDSFKPHLNSYFTTCHRVKHVALHEMPAAFDCRL